MKKIDAFIYSQGFCYTSVCASAELTINELTEWLNNTSPTGIESKWTFDKNNFADGNPNPCECNHNTSRKHYLFNC